MLGRRAVRVCFCVRRQESKSFGHRVLSAPFGIPRSEAGENFFLLPNLPEKQKIDRDRNKIVLALRHAAELRRPSDRDGPVAVPDMSGRSVVGEGD